MSLCVKCKTNKANVPEPCCGAPDCVDTIYLVCSECEQEQYERDMEASREWEDWYYNETEL